MHDTQAEDTRAWSLGAKSTRHGSNWEAKYAYWFSQRRLSRHLALMPMSHQEIRQSEPFQGAPELGFGITKNEFSRQDITSIYFMSHLYFHLRLFWIIIMVCKS